jgi:hypothetical protein
MGDVTCLLVECVKNPHSRGYCYRHYVDLRAAGVLAPMRNRRPKGRVCVVEGCGKVHDSQGYCQLHAKRWRKRGDPLLGGRKVIPAEERFWAFVPVRGDGCWEWSGSVTEKGYGQFGDGRRPNNVRAHRFSWELANGPIPDGRIVLHSCDNPPCVNPAHLRLGSDAENTADMIAKGRAAWQKNPSPPRIKLVKPQPLARTHCRRGHEYTPDSTGWNSRGRHCRSCKRATSRASWARLKPKRAEQIVTAPTS